MAAMSGAARAGLIDGTFSIRPEKPRRFSAVQTVFVGPKQAWKLHELPTGEHREKVT